MYDFGFRVMKTTAVRGDFVPRHATRRRYVYRLAVPRASLPDSSDFYHNFGVPDEKLNRREKHGLYSRGHTNKQLWCKLPHPDNKFIHELR